MLKKIDVLLLKGFIGPFLASFLIALFVLVMQSMWIYIDDIAGKGVGIWVILEMVGFLAIRLIPQALPIGVLIASVMLFGGLAERYELSSMKSAGISLLKIMRPIIFAGSLIGIGSFLCSEYLIPAANLEFVSRIHDIRKKKAALTLEEGVFEDDFKNLRIRIGEKMPNGRDIKDVMIYSQRQAGSNKLTYIGAERGEMFSSEGGRSFIMRLYDGYQYEELNNKNGKGKPLTETKFKEWVKVFDMSDFDLSGGSQDIYKMHHGALTTRELIAAVDSLDVEMIKSQEHVKYNFDQAVRIEPSAKIIERISTYYPEYKPTTIDSGRVIHIDTVTTIQPDTNSTIAGMVSYGDRSVVFKRARMSAENYQRKTKSDEGHYGRLLDRRVKHVFELHSKFALALVCVLFIFLGAPMGAIVRKGGFGYPLLVAVVFFVLFVVMTLSLRRIAESGGIDPVIGAWIPSTVTAISGSFLTYHGIRDSKLGSDNAFFKAVGRLGDLLNRFSASKA